MSERAKRRQVARHTFVLGKLLNDFYTFLSSEPKPLDYEVRLCFKSINHEWVSYCKRHGLDSVNVLDEFKRQVATTWNKKMRKDE